MPAQTGYPQASSGPVQQPNPLADIQSKYSPFGDGGMANTFGRLWAYGALPQAPGGDYQSAFYDFVQSALANGIPNTTSLPFINPQLASGQAYGSLAGSLAPQAPPPDPFQALINSVSVQQPQPQNDFLNQLLGPMLQNSLLNQLLGGFNPQPQPAPPVFNTKMRNF